MTLSSSAPDPVAGDFAVTATMSAPVNDFTIADIVVTNGIASNLSGNGLVYSFVVSPQSNGLISVDVPVGAVSNGASVASNTLVRTAAIAPPQPQPPSVRLFTPSYVVSGPFMVTALFSDDVTGFTADDIRVRNGIVSDFSGKGLSYRFTVTPVDGTKKKRKQISIKVPGRVAESRDGLYNTPSYPLYVKVRRSPRDREANPTAVSDLSGLIRLKNAIGGNGTAYGFGGILGVGDVNTDGYDDLVVGVVSKQTGDAASVVASKPILLTFNPKASRYEVNTSFQRSAAPLTWQQQAAIADFDGDGDKDVFVAGRGLNTRTGPRCGDQNVLVENEGKRFANGTPKLPQQGDASHALAVANLDADPASEILIFNAPGLDKESCPTGHAYLNRSYGLDYDKGAYAVRSLTGSETDLNTTETSAIAIRSATAADFNGDGLVDLAVGSDHALKILLATESGRYAHGLAFVPPANYSLRYSPAGCQRSQGQCNTPYSAITPYDFDGDGDLDIIAALLNQTQNGTWRGYYLQALRNDGTTWADVTSAVFGAQTQAQDASGRWCTSLTTADVDGDGAADLICSQNMGFDYKSPDAIRLFKSGRFVNLGEAMPGLQAKFEMPEIDTPLAAFLLDEPSSLRPVRLGKQSYLLGITPQFKNNAFFGFGVLGLPLSPLP